MQTKTMTEGASIVTARARHGMRSDNLDPLTRANRILRLGTRSRRRLRLAIRTKRPWLSKEQVLAAVDEHLGVA